jgi:hypothetical protein
MDDDRYDSFLSLRAGTFQRVSVSTVGRATRQVSISECPVVRWISDLKDDKQTNEKFSLSIREMMPGETLWAEKPDKIGAFSSDRLHVTANLHLSPFQHFWSAAEAKYAWPPSIEIALKKEDDTNYLYVTNVRLVEDMTSKMDPVAAEINGMEGRLKTLFITLVYTLVAIWTAVTIFGWFFAHGPR